MNDRKVLLEMLKTLYNDAANVQQKGAGYYSTTPFVERYNKLLGQAKRMFGSTSDMLDIFSEIEDTRSVDPSDKGKILQKVALELNQLITFIREGLDGG